MYAHCPTNSLPFRAPPDTDKECVLCIFHKGSAVATRLIVSFLEALKVRIKATISSAISRAERCPSFSPPMNLLVGRSPGPAQHSSTQFGMVVKGTYPDRSCIKQLRIYDARHQPSLSFPRTTNVRHEPSQSNTETIVWTLLGHRLWRLCSPPPPQEIPYTNSLFASLKGEPVYRIFSHIRRTLIAVMRH